MLDVINIAKVLSFSGPVSTSGREKSLPVPNLVSRGDAVSHRSIWKQETASQCWANLKQIFLFCTFLSKICLADSLLTQRCSTSSFTVIHLSFITMVQASTFSLD
jgi:hypothetical protein